MREKPDIQDGEIVRCLRNAYGLDIRQIDFLPLGADTKTAVYCAAAEDGTRYFVKLRQGAFDETIAMLPRLLYDQGVRQTIPPLPARSGAMWATLGEFKLTVSPFIEGRSGFEVDLSEQQWVTLGRALRGLHTAVVSPALKSQIPHETYSPYWRDRVKAFQAYVETTRFDDPIAAGLAALMNAKRDVIGELVSRAEHLAGALQKQAHEFVLCHGDIHAGNVLIDPNGALYVVDWDTLVFAPKERDLMFIGAGIGDVWNKAQEAALFYQGYGQTGVDPAALVYYRSERIVEDIAAYCQEILLGDVGEQDRVEGLRQLTGQFAPGSVIDIARTSEQILPPEL